MYINVLEWYLLLQVRKLLSITSVSVYLLCLGHGRIVLNLCFNNETFQN